MQFPSYNNLVDVFSCVQNTIPSLLKVNVGCDDFIAHNSKFVLRK